MKPITTRFIWLSIFAVAMALLEAVVVAYIRGLYAKVAPPSPPVSYHTMELWREAATLVMLFAVGWLSGRRWSDRLAYAFFAFGVWDIWYYIWLKVFLDWPASLLDWDVLFLLPLPWWGPVLSPVLIALLICLTSLLAVIRWEQGRGLATNRWRLSLIGLGLLAVLTIFMIEAAQALWRGQPDQVLLRPDSFPWLFFLGAFSLMAIPGLLITWPISTSR